MLCRLCAAGTWDCPCGGRALLAGLGASVLLPLPVTPEPAWRSEPSVSGLLSPGLAEPGATLGSAGWFCCPRRGPRPMPASPRLQGPSLALPPGP